MLRCPPCVVTYQHLMCDCFIQTAHNNTSQQLVHVLLCRVTGTRRTVNLPLALCSARPLARRAVVTTAVEYAWPPEGRNIVAAHDRAVLGRACVSTWAQARG